MKLIETISLTKYFGSDLIFQDITFALNTGDRVGIVGANGTGKSTLLKCITGLEEASEGRVKIDQDAVLGYVPQEPVFSKDDETVINEVTSEYRCLERGLRELETAMAEVTGRELDSVLNKYQGLRDAWDNLAGDSARDRAVEILTALGLGQMLWQPVGTLSGGEKSVLALAGALLKKPNVLILDEPGNHLDIQGFTWLEAYLQNFPGAVLTVSHNRYFLDKLCTGILELENGLSQYYTGNYSDYRFEKMQDAVSLQNKYNQQQKKQRQIAEMVRRFSVIASARPDPAWGKRLKAAKTRLSQLQEQAVHKPELKDPGIEVELQNGNTKSDIALQIHDVQVQVEEHSLISGIELTIACGEKLGLIGPNGCGKSTLIRKILTDHDWHSGAIRVGPSLSIGYVAQYPKFKNPNALVLDEVRSWGALSRDEAFSLLQPLRFSWEELGKKIGVLSGGEAQRIQIAKCMYQKADFLILDEPTNHLDLPSREAVEEAILDFQGTVLVVSHDRYFLDRIVDKIAAVEEKKLNVYNGGFTAYRQKAGERFTVSSGKVTRRAKEREAGAVKTQNKKTDAIEQRIITAEAEQAEIEKEIEAAFRRGDNPAARALSFKLQKLNKRISQYYTEWEKAGT
ncbi:MAG: ribosomal protection-like ABC-F family protein [Spirochaetia bacterium]